jgi:hypothetical protein
MTMLAVWLERSIGLVRAWMPPALGTACGMACVLCLTWGQAGTAHAATVQIEVLDAAGKPVGDAVVFLESAQARRQVRPLAALEMAQQKAVCARSAGGTGGLRGALPQPRQGAPPRLFAVAGEEVRAQALRRHTGQPGAFRQARRGGAGLQHPRPDVG